MKTKTKVLGLALFALFLAAMTHVNAAYDDLNLHGIREKATYVGGKWVCPGDTCRVNRGEYYCLEKDIGYVTNWAVCRRINGNMVLKVYRHGNYCNSYGCDSTDGYGKKLYCMKAVRGSHSDSSEIDSFCCYGNEEAYYNNEGDCGCRKKTSTVTTTPTAQKKCYFRPSNNIGMIAYDSGKEYVFYGYTYKCTEGTWSRVAKPYQSQYAREFSCYNSFMCYYGSYYDVAAKKMKARLWARNINSGARWYYNNRWIRE